MIINVFSREKAREQNKIDTKNTAWISVYDFGHESPIVSDNKLDLCFDDVIPLQIRDNFPHPYYANAFKTREPIMFTEEMAEQTISFVKNALSNPYVHLNVHCWAGRSRSMGIAVAINEIFNVMYRSDSIAFYRFYENNIGRSAMNSYVHKVIIEKYLETHHLS